MALDVRKPATIQDVGAATTKLNAKIAPAFKAAKTENGTVSFFAGSDTTGTPAFSFDFPEKNSPAFKAAKTENGTVSFFTDSDTTGTAAFAFNFPEEIYLRQLGTQIVRNFTFDSATYKGAANPQLNGKTVFTLAVRGDSDTVTYSFVDMSELVDVYTNSDTSVTVENYKIKVNIDASSDNFLTLTNNGLKVDGSALKTTPYTNSDTSVTVDNYKVKVNLDASSDNILALTENGLFVDGSALKTTPYTESDSSVAIADNKVKVNISAAQNNALTLNDDGLMVDPANLNIDFSQLEFDTSDLMPRQNSAAEGNFAVFDSDGSVIDADISFVDNAEVNAYLGALFAPKINFVII